MMGKRQRRRQVKLAILGGSFNPVHLGHLFLVDAVLSSLQYDRVVMIPAYRSPFKLAAKDMEDTAGDRLEMLAAAVSGDPRLAVDDCEIRRGGISYTVDTLEDIIARYLPDGKPALIIGDDVATEFLNWKDSKKILSLADIIVARRINSERVDYPFPHTRIDNEVMNVSSQMTRERIQARKDWRSLVPSDAAAVIEDRRLYGFSDGAEAQGENEDCGKRAILRVEAAARETLNMARFLHSRNTALLAHDLCLRFGLDPKAGYLAGIAHDLGKQLGNEKLLELAKSDGMKITSLEKVRPNLLHGRAAAVLLKENYRIHNKDVLEAVVFHTSGSPDMGPLAKVVYIADKIEVSRNIYPAMRKTFIEEGNLDSLLYTVLKKTVSKLQDRKLELSDETKRLLEKMKENRR
jgi:nicotinate-nucleotide adenylyltransferase